MTSSATGVYFDGQTSRRQDVHVEIESELAIYRADGARIIGWPYADIRELVAPAGLVRLTRDGGPPLARLEMRDPAFIAEIRARAPRLDAAQAAESGTTRKVVVWSLAAVVSLTLFGFYGIPALATAATPLLPWSVDRSMGETADRQLRNYFPVRAGGFACGTGSQEKPGRDALDRMAKKLSDAAGLPVPIEVVAVRSDFVNALALPGSPIYMFDGLIQRAKSSDELAGVLAHEIGHVANRDGTRRTLQAGGTSLVLGFILGDVFGGTIAITVAQALSEASYSRDAEREADLYSVRLMQRVGADGAAMGGFLTRLGADEEKEDAAQKAEAEAKQPAKADEKAKDRRSAIDWMASHPATEERRKAIEAAAGTGPTTPVVDDADFLAIKRICGPAR